GDAVCLRSYRGRIKDSLRTSPVTMILGQDMRRSKPAAVKERGEVKSDLLARAFLDILAREDGVHSKSMLRSGSGDASDPVEILLDDLMDTPAEERISVRPDVAAVAVLTARAIERETGLTRILRRGAPVVAVATHTPDRVAPVQRSEERRGGEESLSPRR